MKTVKLLAVLIAIVFGLNMAACCGGGTTVETKSVVNQAPVGEQIESLDKAYKSGAITKEEYEKLKQGIMDKVAVPK
jgi:hypothetical protein